MAVGETVVCLLEPGNFHDRNIVAVEKDGKDLWLFATEGIMHLCCFSEDKWNHSLHCDCKMVSQGD